MVEMNPIFIVFLTEHHFSGKSLGAVPADGGCAAGVRGKLQSSESVYRSCPEPGEQARPGRCRGAAGEHGPKHIPAVFRGLLTNNRQTVGLAEVTDSM